MTTVPFLCMLGLSSNQEEDMDEVYIVWRVGHGLVTMCRVCSDPQVASKYALELETKMDIRDGFRYFVERERVWHD